MREGSEVQKSDRLTSHAGAPSGGEMSLIDLWNLLVRRKVMVLGVAFVTFAVFVANAFFNASVPIYKANASLTLPTDSEIEGFAQHNGYKPEKVFSVFVQTLKSRDMRWRYFNENRLLDKLAPNRGSHADAEQVFEERFNKMLSVYALADHATVSYEGTNAKQAAEWVNGFVAWANEEAVRTLQLAEISRQKSVLEHHKHTIEEKKKAAEGEITTLRMKISDARKNAKRKRKYRIVRLEAAARIAERLGIKDSDIVTLAAGKGVIIFNPKGLPLYLQGTRPLRVEASVLRARKNDDAFDTEINDLQSKLVQWQSQLAYWQFLIAGFGSQIAPVQSQLVSLRSDSAISFIRSAFPHASSMRVVWMATPPDRAFNKPRPKWVVLTGVLSGLTLGVLAALFADFIARAREKRVRQSEEMAG